MTRTPVATGHAMTGQHLHAGPRTPPSDTPAPEVAA